MNFAKIAESKTLKRTIAAIGILAAAFLIFDAGMIVGSHKALFSEQAGRDYYRAFGMHSQKGAMGGGFFSDELASGSGAAGEILKASGQNLVIADKDGTEKTVLVSADTVIRKARETISAADIKVDDYAVAIGSPNGKGEIEARFIRILPPPPDELKESTSTEAAQ